MHKFLLLAAAFISLSLPAFAQDAKVVVLSTADAVHAKELNDERVALDQKVATFRADLQARYLMRDQPITYYSGSHDPVSYPNPTMKEGWYPDFFTFSDDFQFVLQKPFGAIQQKDCPAYTPYGIQGVPGPTGPVGFAVPAIYAGALNATPSTTPGQILLKPAATHKK